MTPLESIRQMIEIADIPVTQYQFRVLLVGKQYTYGSWIDCNLDEYEAMKRCNQGADNSLFQFRKLYCFDEVTE